MSEDALLGVRPFGAAEAKKPALRGSMPKIFFAGQPFFVVDVLLTERCMMCRQRWCRPSSNECAAVSRSRAACCRWLSAAASFEPNKRELRARSAAARPTVPRRRSEVARTHRRCLDITENACGHGQRRRSTFLDSRATTRRDGLHSAGQQADSGAFRRRTGWFSESHFPGSAAHAHASQPTPQSSRLHEVRLSRATARARSRVPANTAKQCQRERRGQGCCTTTARHPRAATSTMVGRCT